jgi:hypothetical protein
MTALFLTAGVIHAEQTEPSAVFASAIDDSTVSLPAQEEAPEAPSNPGPIDFKVFSSRSQRVHVVQASPMEGLPPVTGMATLKVEMVEAPELPEPVQPLPALPVQDSAAIEQIQRFREEHQGCEFVFVSAMVYDHARTYLRIYPNGQADLEVAGWSNVDFNHFTGVGSFRVKEADGRIHDIGLIMGLGKESGAEAGIPNLPDLTNSGPSFVVTKGDSAEALESIDRLHQLYRNEGERLEKAALARAKALDAKKAALLANPPKPADVTIRFWKRPESTLQSSE